MKTKSPRKIAKEWYKHFRYNSKCSICGEAHPATLEFHHRDPKTKIDSVSNMVKQGRPLTEIFKEAQKCDILCANDHRKIHWQWKQERELDR
jgi:hypothetical protein